MPHKGLPTTQELYQGDTLELLATLPHNSAHLAITAPPLWNYPGSKRIVGPYASIQDYDEYLAQLEAVLRELKRILTPGGRLILIVDDVPVSRKAYGRHMIYPLPADLQILARKNDYDILTPILWKTSTSKKQQQQLSTILGAPYEPNTIFRNEIRYILNCRIPGAYRKPTNQQRKDSRIPKHLFESWYKQLWEYPWSSRSHYPHALSIEIATRLVRLFSYVGDTVIDPFMGIGSTLVASSAWGRNGIGIDPDPKHIQAAKELLSEQSPEADISTTTIS